MGTRDTGIGSLTDSTRWSGLLRGGGGQGVSHAVERRVLQLKARARTLKRRYRYRRRDAVGEGMQGGVKKTRGKTDNRRFGQLTLILPVWRGQRLVAPEGSRGEALKKSMKQEVEKQL